MGCDQLRRFNRIDSKSAEAMSSSFPQIVLEQAQIDAEVGRRLDPSRNAFQRAQDFLRDQLSNRIGGPQKGVRTPQQQTDFDAEVGRRVTKQQQQKGSSKDSIRAGGVLSGLAGPASIFTTLATTLTSDSDQTNKWRRLGYPSAEAYEQAMQKVRDKGIDPATGQKNLIYGQLPTDYKRTELLASGQIYGGLPSNLKETEEEMGLLAEKYRPGAGLPEQQFRNTLAPNGGDDKGTQTSPSPMTMKDVNTLLGLQGIRQFEPNQEFNSNQLPTTSASPYGSLSEDAQVMGMSKEDGQLIESGGSVETVFNDGVESSGQIFKDPGSRAFLDYDGKGGSMGAFRAAERARGMITLQGKTYIPNPLGGQDGQDDFTLINQDQRNDINSGRITAQDVSDQYIQRINAPVPGEFKPAMSDIGSYSDQGVASTSDLFSKLVEEEVEMPDFSRKLGLNFETQPNTGIYNPFNSEFKY